MRYQATVSRRRQYLLDNHKMRRRLEIERNLLFKSYVEPELVYMRLREHEDTERKNEQTRLQVLENRRPERLLWLCQKPKQLSRPSRKGLLIAMNKPRKQVF